MQNKSAVTLLWLLLLCLLAAMSAAKKYPNAQYRYGYPVLSNSYIVLASKAETRTFGNKKKATVEGPGAASRRP